MRALHLLALAAAMVVPAAAAHAQFSVYVGPTHRYIAPVPVYGYAPAYAGYWAYGPSGRYWVARHEWRDHRGWDRGHDRGWDRRGGWAHDRRW